jgi:hypothetical protein
MLRTRKQKAFAVGLALLVCAGAALAADTKVNASAQISGTTTEVLVLTTAGGTAVPATALVGRRALEIQNLGPNAIYCSTGTPVLATARKLSAAGGVDSLWALDASDNIVIKCLAATANQVTTAATIVTELK